jgi:hypothetical protein
LAADHLKIEESKGAAEQAKPGGIPKEYRNYAIFGMTLALLGAAAWAVWTLWSAWLAAFRAPTAPVLAAESRKLTDGT